MPSGLFARLCGLNNQDPPAPLNPFPVIESPQPSANATNVSGTVGTTAASVTLTAVPSQITIANTHATNILYFNFTGTATTSNFGLPAGRTVTIQSNFDVTTISVVGSGAGTTYSIYAA